MMELYCVRCRKKTASTGGEIFIRENNRLNVKTKCAECKSNKHSFVKEGSHPKGGQLPDDDKVVEAHELHRPVRKRFPKRRIVTLGIDDLWAADLVIMAKYAIENAGYKYMLNVIDTFSKYAWSEPLLNKTGVTVAKAFERILRKAKSVGHKAPNLLHVDKGKEFVNADFKKMLRSYNIKMYHTENEEKSSVVERFNRTLNEKMKVRFEIRQSFKWYDILQELIDRYNHSTHRTIGMEPSEVDETVEKSLRTMYVNRDKVLSSDVPWRRKLPKFKIGDRVRITAYKETFANKYRRNWRREIFTVTKVQNTDPVTYRITDAEGEEILGSFYEQELQKTTLGKSAVGEGYNNTQTHK